jgi:hypothetical protein
MSTRDSHPSSAVIISTAPQHRPRGRRFPLIAASLFVAASCASSRGAPLIDISVRPDTVAMQQIADPAGVAMSLATVVHNRSDRVLYRSIACQESLQRLIGARWETVWTPVCSGPVGSATASPIAAADSVVVRMDVIAFTSPTASPRRDSRFTAGTYRVVFGLSYRVNDLGITDILAQEHRVSTPFVVVER